MCSNLIRLFAVIWIGVVAFPFAAVAAPQILGLVATVTPLPLSCAAGVCTVEVSGVCLQEHRQAPRTGTIYRVADGSKLTLVVHDRDGKTRSTVVNKLVEVTSLRLFNSLSISLPERFVRDLSKDAVRSSLSIAPLTSLIPVTEVGDPTPLTKNEIRAYTGRLRALAERAFNFDKANLNATRILSQMVNRLPADIPIGAEGITKVFDQTIDAKAPATGTRVTRLVTRALDTCREKLRVERTPHLRACLSNQHDMLNSNTTLNVWKALRPSG
ncbi:MAG: hypothetical protein JXQ99_04605 [Hyphomicrobiaceae bacterium]